MWIAREGGGKKCLLVDIKVANDVADLPLDDILKKTYESLMEDDSVKENLKRVLKDDREERLKLEV